MRMTPGFILLAVASLVGIVVGFTVFGGGTPSAAGATVGLVFAIAGLLAYASLRPEVVSATSGRFDASEANSVLESLSPVRVAVAVFLGLAGLLVTGWPAVAFAAMAAGYGLPALWTSGENVADHAARTEAIAGWIEALRDTMAASRGLEGALVTTARSAPKIIAADLEELVLEIEHGVLVRDALIHTAERLAHPISDMAVATMVMSLDGDATRIGDVLGELAASSRESAKTHLEIHAQRASSRTTVRMIIMIIFFMLASMMVLLRDLMSVYGTTAGQLVLLVGFGGIGASMLWIVRLSTMKPPARMIRPGAVYS